MAPADGAQGRGAALGGDGDSRLGPDGQFDFEAHRRAQRVGTAWLAERRRTMTAFVEAHLRSVRDTRRLEHPERTVASYIFQEAEGVSRKAKVQWARVQGHTVHNLQHDGVILRLDWGEAPQRVAQQLSAVSAHAGTRWMVSDTPATAGSVRRVPHLRQRREEKKPPLLEAARGARPRPPQAEAGALG